jgi:sec-independent protein translocase protein TatA
MPGWIGPWELALLLLVVLLVFGPKRLPEMGRSLGKGMREFKNSITGKEDKSAAELPPPAPEMTQASSTDKQDVEQAREQLDAAAAQLKDAEARLRALEADRS